MSPAIKFKYNKWEVMERFTVKWKGISITVPKGFRTDLASTPRILWAILPPFGKYNTAAIVHDYLYYRKTLSRKTCDEIFLELMTYSKVNVVVKMLFYFSVRAFGGSNYSRKRKQKLCQSR